MYRYTEQKNQQANKKQAARRQARGTALAKTGSTKAASSKPASSRRTSKKKTAKTRASTSKTVALARDVQKKQVKARKMAAWLDRGSSVATFLLALACFVALLAGIYVILMNNFFPRHFALTGERNILLVDANINERAQNLYLLRLDPAASRVTVYLLPGSLEVDLVGQYKRYPLSSVSPLVYRYSENLQEVKAAYNFALGLVLDEFYFVPGAPGVETRAGLQKMMQDLIADNWKRTSQLDQELLADYFALRSSKYFTLDKVSDIADLSSKKPTNNRQQLLHCQLRIYNAAAANGLAKRVSDILTGDGVSVIKLETASEKIDQSTIYYDESEEDCLTLVQMLQANLPKGVIAVPDGGAVARAQRAGAVLYLGEELAN